MCGVCVSAVCNTLAAFASFLRGRAPITCLLIVHTPQVCDIIEDVHLINDMMIINLMSLFAHCVHSLHRCDIIEDVRLINDMAMKAKPRKTGMIILGGGVPKHHICNANLMRNGADFAVYINTGQVRVCAVCLFDEQRILL